jgi:hypothetical protein
MVSQPIVAHGPVVALYISVLLRLAWLDEIDTDASPGGPGQWHGANVLWAVVAADRIRFSAPFDNPLQRSGDALGWRREIDLDSQSLTIEVIDDVEEADAASVAHALLRGDYPAGKFLVRHIDTMLEQIDTNARRLKIQFEAIATLGYTPSYEHAVGVLKERLQVCRDPIEKKP